ncbi:MAG: methyltransferase domain-containing protein [bacterium]
MAFADPAENIKNLDIKEGSKVADFGSGSDFYTIAAARRVHGSGQVFAIDIQKDLLAKVQAAGRDAGLHNIQVVWGNLDNVGGTKLRDSMMDAVIISNILFQSENKENLAKEAFRILKNGGEVLLIDWTDSYGSMGPKQAQIIPEEEGKRIFESAGFRFEKSFFAGDHHWGMVLKK